MTDPTDNTSAAEEATPESETAALVLRLQAALAEAEAKAAASRDAHVRALADLDNVRKRAEREIAAAARYGADKVLGDLLSVADSLDLGLSAAHQADASKTAIVEGLELTRKQLFGVLEKNGVKVVDPTGQPFNPEFHEAVTMMPSADVPPNHVLTVMQRGYRLHDRLLRPAMVVVARAPV